GGHRLGYGGQPAQGPPACSHLLPGHEKHQRSRLLQMSKITERIETLLECVRLALAEAEVEPCETYQTIGSPVVGLCCDCSDGAKTSGELTAHYETIYDADSRTLSRV